MRHKVISILLNIILVLVSCGQLTRISLPEQPIFFYAFEPFVFVSTALMLQTVRKKLRDQTVAKYTGIFLGWMLFSLVISTFWYSMTDNSVAILYFLRLTTYLVFVVTCISYFKMYEVGRWSALLIHFMTGWIVFSSLVQYFLYQNLGNLAYLGWDPHLYRLVGLFFDPPMTIAVFVLIALYYYTQQASSLRQNVLKYSVILAMLILSFLTYSRGGYLGIIAILGAIILHTKNIKLIGLCLGIVVLGFLFIPKGDSEGINLLRTTSIGARFDDYQKAVTIWRKNPLMGIGYNHIRPEKDIYETQQYFGPYNPSHGSAGFHSSFLVILVTSGVVGLSLFLIWLIELARLSQYFLFSVVFLSVISLFDNVLLHPFILVLVGYLGSICHQSSRS